MAAGLVYSAVEWSVGVGARPGRVTSDWWAWDWWKMETDSPAANNTVEVITSHFRHKEFLGSFRTHLFFFFGSSFWQGCFVINLRSHVSSFIVISSKLWLQKMQVSISEHEDMLRHSKTLWMSVNQTSINGLISQENNILFYTILILIYFSSDICVMTLISPPSLLSMSLSLPLSLCVSLPVSLSGQGIEGIMCSYEWFILISVCAWTWEEGNTEEDALEGRENPNRGVNDMQM